MVVGIILCDLNAPDTWYNLEQFVHRPLVTPKNKAVKEENYSRGNCWFRHNTAPFRSDGSLFQMFSKEMTTTSWSILFTTKNLFKVQDQPYMRLVEARCWWINDLSVYKMLYCCYFQYDLWRNILGYIVNMFNNKCEKYLIFQVWENIKMNNSAVPVL